MEMKPLLVSIDVETVGPIDLNKRAKVVAELRENAKAPSNYKKPEAIARAKREWVTKRVSRLGLDVFYNVPVVIVMGILYDDGTINLMTYAIDADDPNTTPELQVQKMLSGFWEDFIRLYQRELPDLAMSGPTVVTHNGSHFDWPTLLNSSLRFGVELPRGTSVIGLTEDLVQRRKRGFFRNIPVIDTMRDWPAPYGEMTKLAKLTSSVGVEPAHPHIDGSMVQEQFDMGDMDSILEHCIDDVVILTAAVAKLLRLPINPIE